MEESKKWSTTGISFDTNNVFNENDMTEGVSSYINLFADDAKLLRKIRNHNDCKELQNDINNIYEWRLHGKWNLSPPKKPCIGNGGRVERDPHGDIS